MQINKTVHRFQGDLESIHLLLTQTLIHSYSGYKYTLPLRSVFFLCVSTSREIYINGKVSDIFPWRTNEQVCSVVM